MASPNIRDARCVLVIGATAGIGRELAMAIHALPHKPTVIVTGRRQERLDELSDKGSRVEHMQLDVTAGRAALKEFVEKAVTQYRRCINPPLILVFLILIFE